MAAGVSRWLTKRELYARTVSIKVRYADFTTVTRSHSANPSRDEQDLVRRAVGLLDRTDAGQVAVRLLGVSVQNFTGVTATPTAPATPRLPFDE